MSDLREITDWGVPDWRDAEAYIPPDERKDDLEYWRWEFFRRRPDYRKAWTCNDADGMKALGYLGDPRQTKFEKRIVTSLVAEVGPDGNVIFLGQPYPVGTENFLKFTFDLDKPWSRQAGVAKETFLREQKKLHGKHVQLRRRTDKWSKYLRVIDARDARISFEEIANTIIQPSINAELVEYDRGQRESGLQIAQKIYKQALQIMFNFPS